MQSPPPSNLRTWDSHYKMVIFVFFQLTLIPENTPWPALRPVHSSSSSVPFRTCYSEFESLLETQVSAPLDLTNQNVHFNQVPRALHAHESLGPAAPLQGSHRCSSFQGSSAPGLVGVWFASSSWMRWRSSFYFYFPSRTFVAAWASGLGRWLLLRHVVLSEPQLWSTQPTAKSL